MKTIKTNNTQDLNFEIDISNTSVENYIMLRVVSKTNVKAIMKVHRVWLEK